MTPRRSSRARTTHPPPPAMQHTNSSNSSSSLSRTERSTRSNNKNTSPRRSSTQRSQSLEDGDGSTKSDLPLTRQRQLSRHDDGNDEMLKLADGDEEDGDEEEITRCICGQQDYPGLPVTSREAAGHSGKSGVKDDPALNSSDPLSDEAGSLFIQCDSCKVWQHGGCVGIMDEATSPDEYFCEECKKDLHRIVTGINGVKSSQYLPVTGSSPPTSSRASSRDNSKKAKESKSRQNSNALSAKRRSTMNSRDAAYDQYDEEEQIRRAIEQSKNDNKPAHEETTSRRGKRSRSDSEANKQAAKRPRTSSPSPSSLSKLSNSASHPESDEETKSKASAPGGTKRARGAASRVQKDTRETEKEQEKERADTTNRRKGNRRRDGNSAPSEEASPTKAAPKSAAPAQSTPDPATTSQEPTSNPKPATRKTGRPPARRRLGRNQYTRDRDQANGNGDAHSASATSPRRGQSHDTGAGDSPNGGQANGINGGESGKPSKPRYMNPHRTTMNEMKRRVAAILEFISRMQVEMAVSGENTSTPAGGASGSNSGTGGNSNDVEAAAALVKGVEAQLGTLAQANGDGSGASAAGASSDGTNGTTTGETSEPPKEKDFKDLTSVEMMDVLTRNLLKWQQEYGKYGEK